MPKIDEDGLFMLIQSMTASEKRYFKIESLKNATNKRANFIKLFDYLATVNAYDEVDIHKQHICPARQLSNLKAHLYQKILDSLRHVPSQQTIDILLRDEISNAVVLYNKGLYQQSLKILNKAKSKAVQYDEHALHFEINKLEKIIESQYITRSEKNRAEELIKDSNELIDRTKRENELMNLTLWLYNYLLKIGYCSSIEEEKMIQTKVRNVLKDIDFGKLAFNEKLWWFKVKVWENLVIRSSKVEEASMAWVDHFYRNEEMIYMHPVWFVRGNHYLLQALFNNHNREQFDIYFLKFNQTISEDSFGMSPNVKNLIFIYKNTALLNQDFLHLNFQNIHQWTYIYNQIKNYENVIDSHYLNIIKFKIGALFFLSRNFEQSQKSLESIVNLHNSGQKDDLYFYSQILLLMNYYDGGDDVAVEDVLHKLQRLVNKRSLYGNFHLKLVEMFEAIFSSSPLEIKTTFENNFSALNNLKSDPDFKRSQRYLNFKIWFKSHINNTPVQELAKNAMQDKII